MTTRRDFIKKTVAGTAALSLGSILPGFGSSRYQDILGANEKIRIGVIGVNSRGKFPKKYNIFPIPSSELRNNIMCEQTPSWK
jgi:hypothetical protein